jgi:hypothetical protein
VAELEPESISEPTGPRRAGRPVAWENILKIAAAVRQRAAEIEANKDLWSLAFAVKGARGDLRVAVVGAVAGSRNGRSRRVVEVQHQAGAYIVHALKVEISGQQAVLRKSCHWDRSSVSALGVVKGEMVAVQSQPKVEAQKKTNLLVELPSLSCYAVEGWASLRWHEAESRDAGADDVQRESVWVVCHSANHTGIDSRLWTGSPY